MLKIFILMLFGSQVTVCRYCPKHWHIYRSSKRCYYFSRKLLSFEAAQNFCSRNEKSARLVRIENEAQNNLIKKHTSGTAWLSAVAVFELLAADAGLNHPGFVLRWTKQEQSESNYAAKYANWDTNAKGMSTANRCVVINQRGKWLNQDCKSKAKVICEKPFERQLGNKIREKCPRKWVWYNETQACYHAITREYLTMLEADDICDLMTEDSEQNPVPKARLASITSRKENDFVLELARKEVPALQFVIIGGTAKTMKSSSTKVFPFHWLDGNPFRYENWAHEYPIKKRQKQVALFMDRTGKWLNFYANQAKTHDQTAAVCKFKPS